MKKSAPRRLTILLLRLIICLPLVGKIAHAQTPTPRPDRVNVTDYGAIPDDGADDTGPINVALTKGKSIYFPAGSYKFTGTIDITGKNASYRFYGDGPGVSTIVFSPAAGGGGAGIAGRDMGENTLNVDGLTLKATISNCGTAIYAIFSRSVNNGGNFRTATIHNVQIVGGTKDENSLGYWKTGVYLNTANHTAIDKLEISGRKGLTTSGIQWETPACGSSPAPQHSYGLQMSNVAVKWCDVALRASGDVEGIYATGFEITSCGTNAAYAVDLSSCTNGGVVHLMNGRIDTLGGGVHVKSINDVKISGVNFTHNAPDVTYGTMVHLENIYDGIVSECSFYGVDPNAVSDENGIFLTNSQMIRIAGNNFTHSQPVNGSSIVVLSGGTPGNQVIRITDNLFSDVRNPLSNGAGAQTYKLGNNPTL